MLPSKVLHVVSVAESLPFLVGNQVDYFSKKGVTYYLASSFSDTLIHFTNSKRAIPVKVEIKRKISILKDIRSIIYLTWFIRKNKIDFVFGHTPKGSLIAMISSYLARVRFRIYVRHGLLFESSVGIRYFLFKNVERLTGLLANKIICVSQSVKNVSEIHRLSNRDKHVILNKGSFNGVDAINVFNRDKIPARDIEILNYELKIQDDDFIFGFVGRLVNDKGVNELLSAWRIFLNDGNKGKLIIIGRFEERDKLPNESIEYLVNEKTIILISETYPINLYYALMHVFILPSHREGLPNVVLEASAMKLPVITTKVTGCVDSIIDGETGLFCSSDPNDILDKMLTYYVNKDLRTSHGLNGRRFVANNFKPTTVWGELEEKIMNIY